MYHLAVIITGFGAAETTYKRASKPQTTPQHRTDHLISRQTEETIHSLLHNCDRDMSTSGPGSKFAHVIDWEEAMEQCGDDEEFLRELLSDLRGEVDAQVVKINEVLSVSHT
jgi:hypothetical protein